MDYLWTILPTPASTAALVTVYLLVIWWVRRPERADERKLEKT